MAILALAAFVLGRCSASKPNAPTAQLVVVVPHTAPASAEPGALQPRPGSAELPPEVPPAEASDEEPDAYYPNCTAARAAGAAPIHEGEPGYASRLDRDGDGVACE
ncbi:MAG: excalibur calcium-binding domain-containing protein [Sphingomonas sp.]